MKSKAWYCLVTTIFCLNSLCNTEEWTPEKVEGWLSAILLEPLSFMEFDPVTKTNRERTHFPTLPERVQSFQREYKLSDEQIIPHLEKWARAGLCDENETPHALVCTALLSLEGYPSQATQDLLYQLAFKGRAGSIRTDALTTYIATVDITKIKVCIATCARNGYQLPTSYDLIARALEKRYPRLTPEDQEAVKVALKAALNDPALELDFIRHVEPFLTSIDPEYAISKLHWDALKKVEYDPVTHVRASVNSKIPHARYVATELQKLRKLYEPPKQEITNDVSVSVDL